MSGHGTAVAALVAGNRVGVAKNATIIPVKVARCDRYSARARVAQRAYVVGETMWVKVAGECTLYYVATTNGTTGAAEPAWPTMPGSKVKDGGDDGVTWECFSRPTTWLTTAQLADGLDWIMRDYDPAHPEIQWTPGTDATSQLVQRRIAGQGWGSITSVSATTTTFSEQSIAPGGMVLYRIVASKQTLTSPSAPDFVNLLAATYEPITAQASPIDAQHIVELRSAVNALCDAAGIAQRFSGAELNVAALRGQVVSATHFTNLLAAINAVRTAPELGMAAAAFSTVPAIGGSIHTAQITALRNALE